MGDDVLEPFYEAQFLALTTFRADGTPKMTPVVFAIEDRRILVRTELESFKARRVAANPRVQVAPSGGFNGKASGRAIDGTVRFLDDIDGDRVIDALYDKYQDRFGDVPSGRGFLEITLDE